MYSYYTRRGKRYPVHLKVRHNVTVRARECFIGRLPEELLDQVFATLIKAGYLKAVASCSLVSKPWLRRARPHLFATIVARPRTKFPTLADSIGFLENHKHIAEHVSDLTFAPAPADPGSFESISLNATRYSETSTSRDPLKHPLRLECAILASLLPTLPRLRALRLRQVAFSVNSEEWSVVSDGGPFIRTLDVLELRDIYSCGSGRTSPLLALLSILKASAIDTLRFDNLDGTPSRSKEEHRPQPQWERPALDVGDLSIMFPEKMPELSMEARHFKFYEQMIRPGSLRSLSAQCLSWEDTAQMGSFVRACGERITYLGICITRLVHGEEWAPQNGTPTELPAHRWRNLAESLFSCERLEHLRLWIPYGRLASYPDRPSPPSCDYIFPVIFSAEAPRTLRRMDILLRYHWDGHGHAPHDIELWGLHKLNDVLMQRDRFPLFDHMQITIETTIIDTHPVLCELKKRLLEEELPDLYDAGILDLKWERIEVPF